jgi:hypothetical protein
LSRPFVVEVVRRVFAAALATGVFLVAVSAAFLVDLFAGDFFFGARSIGSLLSSVTIAAGTARTRAAAPRSNARPTYTR